MNEFIYREEIVLNNNFSRIRGIVKGVFLQTDNLLDMKITKDERPKP